MSRDLIFVSMEDWDDVWRRNQFVCAELARRDPTRRILFVGLSRHISNMVRPRMWGNVFRRSTYAVPGIEQIMVTHPLKLWPEKWPVGRSLNRDAFRRHVQRIARRMKLNKPVLWLNPHSAYHLVGKMGESYAIYDVTDDWTALTQSPWLQALVREQDHALCKKADAVIVCSERLFQLKSELSERVCLVPNGVDLAHYAPVLDHTAAISPEVTAVTTQWRGPVLGYTGTLHPDRVDVSLIMEVAKAWDGSIALIGPNHLPPSDIERLRLPNVHIVGPVPYALLPQYMRSFGACIVPHKMTPFTESLNPIKLWEYLAAGKPIISTDVAGFRDYPDLVELARTVDEFLLACIRAVAGEDERSDRRRAAVAEQSWGARVDVIERIIDRSV